VEQEKFIITRSHSPKGVLEMKEVGDNFALCHSEKGFQDSDVAAFGCGCGEIKFNNKTGRYLRTSSCGYIGGDELKIREFTPYIEIGKCSPF
jgi:hypothetical protein